MNSELSPLERLSEATGIEFNNLMTARESTREGLKPKIAALGSGGDKDVSVVMMGSWGRREVTSESDDDFMALVHGTERAKIAPTIPEIAKVLDAEPGIAGYFGGIVGSADLVNFIGLDEDDVCNLTRRLLLLLESVPLTNESEHAAVIEESLARYLSSAKDYRPPRFLLNDVVRYWRTICVDFAGKHKENNEKWGLRNAKLRTYRKGLFAGGLLPVLECSRLKVSGMTPFLTAQFSMPPTDRIAESFLRHSLADSGARCMLAYDAFVGRLDDAEFRSELIGVTPTNKGESAAFVEARDLGHQFQKGLLALLFETDLKEMVREYAIF